MTKKIEDLIPEINALEKKGKEVGLTDVEKKRQQKLRSEYIKIFRAQFKQQLESVKIVDEHGHDITPKKKDMKKIN